MGVRAGTISETPGLTPARAVSIELDQVIRDLSERHMTLAGVGTVRMGRQGQQARGAP